VVPRLSWQPLDLRRFAEAVSDVQRLWAVAVAYHSGVALERLVALVRGVVDPPDEVEVAAIEARIAELHQQRGLLLSLVPLGDDPAQ
jgi:hypothetical protein